MGHKKMEVTRHYIKDDIKAKKQVFIEASKQATSDKKEVQDDKAHHMGARKQEVKRKGKSKSKLVKRKNRNDYGTKEELQVEAA